MQERGKDIAAMLRAIDELDFERIKAKLVHRHGGAMSSEAVERAEAGYRQFLKLAAKYPDVPVVPGEAVDEFWHMHILDTRRYAADCERIFGHILHHDPYMGIDGPEDEVRLQKAAERSHALYVREFGEAAEGMAYCIRPMAEESSSAAWCIREAKGASSSSAAWCIREAEGASSSSAAWCIREAEGASSSAAWCIREAKGAFSSSAAWCIRPLAEASSSAAYCIRPAP
jgi:hypothetical protein